MANEFGTTEENFVRDGLQSDISDSEEELSDERVDDGDVYSDEEVETDCDEEEDEDDQEAEDDDEEEEEDAEDVSDGEEDAVDNKDVNLQEVLEDNWDEELFKYDDGEGNSAEGPDGVTSSSMMRGKKRKIITSSKERMSEPNPKKRRGKGKGKKSKGKTKKKTARPKNLRRNIKRLLSTDMLDLETINAQREEEERKKRLEEQKAMRISPGVPSQLKEILAAPPLIPEPRLSIADTNDYIILESSSSSEEEKPKIPKLTKIPIPVPVLPFKPDVIEISSSDDEVRVLSEDASEEEDEEEEVSGTHTWDRYNIPDGQGRVLVNVNHPLHEIDVYLPPHLAATVKPHQIGGIRFLYDNLIESLGRFQSSAGFGCILAHSMGLGKTIQMVCFIDIFLRHTLAKSALCIVPINTLQNWVAEFEMWLPVHGDEEKNIPPRQFELFVLNDTHKTTSARAKVIGNWHKSGGVLLMGYEMYRLLCSRKYVGGRTAKKKTKKEKVIDLEQEERNEIGLENIRMAICRPGPDLVVCDEGHRIKNSLAGISKALKNIKTRRRVVLTGYPLQNNLMEYWCMVDFVRPNYLGTKHEFSNLFERPIQNGQCVDSTPKDVKLMKYRAHVLHNRLEGFVQRRGFKVLWTSLPPKEEHVILVRMTSFQRGLYCKFMQCFKDAGAGGWCSTNPLKAFAVGCKIWNHPDILHTVLQQREELDAVDRDLDIPEIASKSSKNKNKNKKVEPLVPEMPGSSLPAKPNMMKDMMDAPFGNMSYQEKVSQILSFEWAREIMKNYRANVLSNGGKMVLLFNIIEESIKLGDKLLVFSQSLMTLSLIEKFLSMQKIPDPPNKPANMCMDWIRNKTYFRLDGSTAVSDREKMINQFNEKTNDSVWLFLLSTRAGCLGVNLIGANRVVVLDASWNPCHDAQAVCRVYRYGQTKKCHVYRFVTDNTLEKKIYDRQISKKGMADRVVDELNPEMNLTKKEVESLLEFDESDMPYEDFGHLENKYSDHILRTIVAEHSKMICKAPFSTESLLWDRKDQKLSKAEKQLAKKGYEEELRLNMSYSRPSYAAYYPKGEEPMRSSVPPPPGMGQSLPFFGSAADSGVSIPYLLNNRGQIRLPERPVASVRPVQSTPVPKQPPVPLTDSQQRLQNLKQAGVSVQRIIATTDIILPGTNTISTTSPVIKAGEMVTFIKTLRGIYLRTNDGRFIAVRGTNLPRPPPVMSTGHANSGLSSNLNLPLVPHRPNEAIVLDHEKDKSLPSFLGNQSMLSSSGFGMFDNGPSFGAQRNPGVMPYSQTSFCSGVSTRYTPTASISSPLTNSNMSNSLQAPLSSVASRDDSQFSMLSGYPPGLVSMTTPRGSFFAAQPLIINYHLPPNIPVDNRSNTQTTAEETRTVNSNMQSNNLFTMSQAKLPSFGNTGMGSCSQLASHLFDDIPSATEARSSPQMLGINADDIEQLISGGGEMEDTDLEADLESLQGEELDGIGDNASKNVQSSGLEDLSNFVSSSFS